MTSCPASRRARAITLAPRSCPSRPGLAMRIRRGTTGKASGVSQGADRPESTRERLVPALRHSTYDWGMPISNLHGLTAAGVSVWSDQISKQMLDSGELAERVEGDAVTGVTS